MKKIKLHLQLSINLRMTFTAILIFGFLIIKAQKDTIKFDYTLLPNVEVKGELDTAKYLWNILNKNQELLLKDTSLFYELDYKIIYADNDSSYENFNGIVNVIIINKKTYMYLCSGKYINKNKNDSVNLMRPYLSFISKGYMKFKKFKRNFNLSLDNFNQTFELTADKKKQKTYFKYFFKNKKIKKIVINRSTNKSILYYKFNEANAVIDYINLKNQNIIKNIYIELIYSYKKIKVITQVNFSLTNKQNCLNKILMKGETPNSLYQKLLEQNKANTDTIRKNYI